MFHTVVGGQRLTGAEVVTLHGRRLWRVLMLLGAAGDFPANSADLAALLRAWHWR